MDVFDHVARSYEGLDLKSNAKGKTLELPAAAEISGEELRLLLPVRRGRKTTKIEAAVISHYEILGLSSDRVEDTYRGLLRIKEKVDGDTEKFLDALRQSSKPLEIENLRLQWTIAYRVERKQEINVSPAAEIEASVNPYARRPGRTLDQTIIAYGQDHETLTLYELIGALEGFSPSSIRVRKDALQRGGKLQSVATKGKEMVYKLAGGLHTVEAVVEAVPLVRPEPKAKVVENPPREKKQEPARSALTGTLHEHLIFALGETGGASAHQIHLILDDSFSSASVKDKLGERNSNRHFKREGGPGSNYRLTEEGQLEYARLTIRLGTPFKQEMPATPIKYKKKTRTPKAGVPRQVKTLYIERSQKLLTYLQAGILTPEGAAKRLRCSEREAKMALDVLVGEGNAREMANGFYYQYVEKVANHASTDPADPLKTVITLQPGNEEAGGLKAWEINYLESSAGEELSPAYVTGKTHVPVAEAAERIESLKRRGLLSGEEPEKGSISRAGLLALYKDPSKSGKKRRLALGYLIRGDEVKLTTFTTYGITPEMLLQYQKEGTIEIKGPESNPRLCKVSITENGKEIYPQIRR